MESIARLALRSIDMRFVSKAACVWLAAALAVGTAWGQDSGKPPAAPAAKPAVFTAGRSLAGADRSQQRDRAGVFAAGEFLGRQCPRLPLGRGGQGRRHGRRDLRRHLGHRAHAGGPRYPHGYPRGPQGRQAQFPGAARQRPVLHHRAGPALRDPGAHDCARPPEGVARRGRGEATDSCDPERPAADHRELHAGDPGARSPASPSSRRSPATRATSA